MKNLFDILPVYGVEHDAILSKMGDVTVAFKVELPELFTLSNDEDGATEIRPNNSFLHDNVD